MAFLILSLKAWHCPCLVGRWDGTVSRYLSADKTKPKKMHELMVLTPKRHSQHHSAFLGMVVSQDPQLKSGIPSVVKAMGLWFFFGTHQACLLTSSEKTFTQVISCQHHSLITYSLSPDAECQDVASGSSSESWVLA